MTTGSKAADERIARLVAAAPPFSDERFALIKGILQDARAAARLAEATADVPPAKSEECT